MLVIHYWQYIITANIKKYFRNQIFLEFLLKNDNWKEQLIYL